MDSTVMKILFNTPNPSLKGGPPTHLPYLEAGLREHLAVFPFEYGRKSDHETMAQKVFGRLGDLLMTRALISAIKPDIIHHNSAFDPRAIVRDAPLARIASGSKAPLFIKIHGSLPEAFTTPSRLVQHLRNELLQRVTALGVLSQTELEEFEEEFPATRGKVHVVKNILKPEFFDVQRSEAERPTVLFISRFIKRKGIFDLLDAVPLILRELPDARFVFVGDGEDAEEFDKRVRSMRLEFCVERKAHVNNSETKKYYSSAWAFVFPTHFPEGMPMVVAEAMAAGVPIVTTRTRFSTSYMTEGKHCFYTQYGNPESIATQTLKLLNDTPLRLTMSAAVKELAYSFTAEPVTREFIQLYHRILGLPVEEPASIQNEAIYAQVAAHHAVQLSR